MTEYKTLTVTYLGERDQWKTPVYGDLWQWRGFWLMGCPACGRVATLKHTSGGHTVTLEGEVPVLKATISPSIGCPYQDCDAHYFVKNGEVVPA